MALELNGWIDGITSSGVVLLGIIFGLFFIYKARKTGAKLLLYLGLANMLAGLMFLGVFTDFLLVLITQHNIENNGIVAILSYIWFAPVIITSMYIGAWLLTPKIKLHIVIIFLIISIAFEIIIFIDPLNSFNFIPEPPTSPDGVLIDYNVNLLTIAGILMSGLLLPVLVFLGFGFLFKGLKTSGVIRKNFLYLSIGAFVYTIGGIMDGLFSPGVILIFIRSAMIGSSALFYLGLRT